MLISTTGAPAIASALHGLQQAYDGERQPSRLSALVGASVMSAQAGEAYDHVLAVNRVQRLLKPLANRGWLVLPSIRFEGLPNQEVDFFVLSPLGAAYVMLAQRYARGRMTVGLSEIRGYGFRDSLPKAVRERSLRIEQLLKDNDVAYSSLTPVTVLVDTERVRAAKSTISLALTDWKLVRTLLARENVRRSFGDTAIVPDQRLLAAEFWQELERFDSAAYASDGTLFRQLRRWSLTSLILRRLWSIILTGLVVGAVAFALLQALTPQQMLMF